MSEHAANRPPTVAASAMPHIAAVALTSNCCDFFVTIHLLVFGDQIVGSGLPVAPGAADGPRPRHYQALGTHLLGIGDP